MEPMVGADPEHDVDAPEILDADEAPGLGGKVTAVTGHSDLIDLIRHGGVWVAVVLVVAVLVILSFNLWPRSTSPSIDVTVPVVTVPTTSAAADDSLGIRLPGLAERWNEVTSPPAITKGDPADARDRAIRRLHVPIQRFESRRRGVRRPHRGHLRPPGAIVAVGRELPPTGHPPLPCGSSAFTGLFGEVSTRRSERWRAGGLPGPHPSVGVGHRRGPLATRDRGQHPDHPRYRARWSLSSRSSE